MGIQTKNQRRLQQGGNNGDKFIAEISSSENSVSVDASHSDDDIQVCLGCFIIRRIGLNCIVHSYYKII